MTDLSISEITDHDIVRASLLQDRDYSAYALGDLEPPYMQHARWYAAVNSSELIVALALHYSGLDPEVLFLMGDRAGIDVLLRHEIGPDRVYYTAKPEIETSLGNTYNIPDIHYMFRMRVAAEDFAATPLRPATPGRIVSLHDSDSQSIIDLQRRASEADGREWHDIAFAPAMLQDGYYYGFEHDYRLLAVAGTHITAPRARMAAVGNVVVDPAYRRQGLGAFVSQIVTHRLLEDGYELIVLNVRQGNDAAVATYRKLGYRVTGQFIEGLATRK